MHLREVNVYKDDPNRSPADTREFLYKGWYHGQDMIMTRDDRGNITNTYIGGIVEKEDGFLETVFLDQIQFIDPPLLNLIRFKPQSNN